MRVHTEVGTPIVEALGAFCKAQDCSTAQALRWAICKMIAEWRTSHQFAAEYEKWFREALGDGNAGGQVK